MTQLKKMRNSFVEAIVAEPKEMSHRLIFSDWLEDHGEEKYAEFIRLQIKEQELPVCKCTPIFSIRNCPTCSEVKPLRLRSQFLLLELADDFRPNVDFSWSVLRYMPRRENSGSCVRCGFVWGIRCSTNTWLRKRHEFIQNYPLERVELTDRAPALSLRNITETRNSYYWRTFSGNSTLGREHETNEELIGDRSNFRSGFESIEEALDWLSDQLIQHAKFLNYKYRVKHQVKAVEDDC